MRVEQLNFIGRRRYVRVGIRRAIDWIAMASIVVAASQEPQAWANFTDYLLHYLTAWWAELHGETPEPHYFTISWAALGYLALVLIPYGVTRSFWRVWNEAEMRAIVEGRAPRADVSVPISMFLQVVIGLVLLFEQFPPFWIFLPIVIGVVAAHFIALSFADPYQMDDVAQSVPSNEPRSNVDHVWSLVKFFVTLHFVNFSLGLGGWEAFVWLVDTLFGGSILAFRPDAVPSLLVGILFVVIGPPAFWAWSWLSAKIRAGWYLQCQKTIQIGLEWLRVLKRIYRGR